MHHHTPKAARPVTSREFRERWRDVATLVFATVPTVAGTAPAQFADQVFQPGYTFTLLPGRESPFPEPADYDRLRSFAAAVGDETLLAQYMSHAWWSDAAAEDGDRVVAGLFSSSATWDEMRTATVGQPAGPLDGNAPALSFEYGFSDLYVWSPRALWGIVHSSDAELAIAGTWGPNATLALRAAFGVEGDGWTDDLLFWWSGAGVPVDTPSPLVTDMYARRPLVAAPGAEITPELPAEEQDVLEALYSLALTSAQPHAGVSASGAAQVRWAIAEAIGRQYRPAVTVALGASESHASDAVRAAAAAVLAAAHRLGTDEALV